MVVIWYLCYVTTIAVQRLVELEEKRTYDDLERWGCSGLFILSQLTEQFGTVQLHRSLKALDFLDIKNGANGQAKSRLCYRYENRVSLPSSPTRILFSPIFSSVTATVHFSFEKKSFSGLRWRLPEREELARDSNCSYPVSLSLKIRKEKE